MTGFPPNGYILREAHSSYTFWNEELSSISMSETNSTGSMRSRLLWVTIGVIALGGGAIYWQSEREAARQRVELARIVSEQAQIRRVNEIEEKRERERQRLADEIRTLKEAEDAQRQQAMAIRQDEVNNKQFVADDRYVPPGQAALQSQIMQYDQARQNISDRNQRYEDESNLRRARADVERQKRYLQQRDYEEQSARARRDSAARYGR